MERYDLCVIGGGPAGYAAAMRAIDLGLRTVLIEKDRIGGTGIYNGALTSKTLWELAQRVASANEVIRARGREPFRLGWDEIGKTLNEAVFERKYLYACHMQLLENAGDKFKHERGKATFLGPNTIEVIRGEHRCVIEAGHFIVATGSRPRGLPDIVADEKHILTSDGIFNIDDLPESIVIIGAGVIGCEFATIFTNFGRTKVHIIDRAARVLPFEDPDISHLISHSLERKNAVIHRNSKLERIAIVGGKVEYELTNADGHRETVRVDKALISVGRIPNIDGLGLTTAGVALDPQTGLAQITDTRTSQPHIHIVGDATGSNMLVNLGELEGRHAVELISGIRNAPLAYGNVSTIMFLDPEVAGIGANEQELRKNNIPYRLAKIDYACLARAIAMRKTKGFFKVLVTDDEDMKVLGMRAVGEHASSAIQAVALMMQTGLGIGELAELIHPHPSITEGVQECARMLLGKSIFKSPVFGDKMQCYRWRPSTEEVKAA
ncbi:MAG: NAD(P)/FAD-dependent oxidoreductase [Flavobacteriales bacterium]|nr:NAD(P)/FAD-dependent oxidoreductase [Flavobacteriales bacterium]